MEFPQWGRPLKKTVDKEKKERRRLL